MFVLNRFNANIQKEFKKTKYFFNFFHIKSQKCPIDLLHLINNIRHFAQFHAPQVRAFFSALKTQEIYQTLIYKGDLKDLRS